MTTPLTARRTVQAIPHPCGPAPVRPCAPASLRLCVALLILGACRASPHRPTAVGTLEVTEVDLAPSLPARVTAVRVDEGDRVRPGDTVAILTQAGLSDQVAEARARVASAEARLAEMENGSRPEDIRSAEATLAAASATAERAAKELARIKALAPTGVSTAQQLDDAAAAARESESRRAAAEEALRLVRAGPRPEQISAQRAALAQARAALAAIQATAHDLILTSDVDAIVLSRNAEPGEVLAGGTSVITLGEVRRPFTRVYVGPAVLPTIRVGDLATGVLDGFPGHPYPGRVVAIASRAEFTPRVALTEEERGDLLFGVKVAFDDTTGALHPGLPITVTLGTAR